MFAVVAEVNDVKIKNLAHLAEILRDADGQFIVFKFASRQRETLVFDREDLLASTDEILEDNGIRYQGSKYLRSIWQPPADHD